MTEELELPARITQAIQLADARLKLSQEFTSRTNDGRYQPNALTGTLSGLTKALNTLEADILAHASDDFELNCIKQLSPVLDWCIEALAIGVPEGEGVLGKPAIENQHVLKASIGVLDSATNLFGSLSRFDYTTSLLAVKRDDDSLGKGKNALYFNNVAIGIERLNSHVLGQRPSFPGGPNRYAAAPPRSSSIMATTSESDSIGLKRLPNFLGKTHLHMAARSDDIRVITRYISEPGADVNAKDFQCRTPLHDASENFAAAKLLLGNGADVSAVDNVGRTPLHEATRSGDHSVARLLLVNVARAMAVDNGGRTSLHDASLFGHLEVVRLLLDAGAAATTEDNDGRTPLHSASSFGHYEVAEILLEEGANILAVDKAGRTSLHEAVRSGDARLTKFFLERGATVSAVDNRGRSPLIYAAEGGHRRLIKILIEHGATPDVFDSHGRTPSDLAWDPTASRKTIQGIDDVLTDNADRSDDDSQGIYHAFLDDEVGNYDSCSDIESLISADFANTSTNNSSLLNDSIQLAILQLATILFEEIELRTLFESVRAKFGKGRFIRNCCRHLKRLGHSLQGEANGDLQNQFAAFIRKYASQVAVEVEVNMVLPGNTDTEGNAGHLPDSLGHLSSWTNSPYVIKTETTEAENITLNTPKERNTSEGQIGSKSDNDVDYSSDEESSQAESNESDSIVSFPIADVGALKKFLLSSRAVVMLRNDLREWVDSGRGRNPRRLIGSNILQSTEYEGECSLLHSRPQLKAKNLLFNVMTAPSSISVTQEVNKIQHDLQREYLMDLLPSEIANTLSVIPASDIWITRTQDNSMSNTMKTWVEEKTHMPWIWWPLSPRRRVLQEGEARIFWRCSCGTVLWQEVSNEDCKLTKRLISLPREDKEKPQCATRTKMSGWNTFTGHPFSTLNPGAFSSQRYSPAAVSLTTTSTSWAQPSVRPGNNPVTYQNNGTPSSDTRQSPDPLAAPVQQSTPTRNWVLLGVQGQRRTIDPAEILIDQWTTDHQFFKSLKASYRRYRGKLRLWFSIWRLHYCEVVMFHRLTLDRMVRDHSDLPTHDEYRFDVLFNACDIGCNRVLPHDCFQPPGGMDQLERIPKRLRSFQRDMTVEIWGLSTVHDVSFALNQNSTYEEKDILYTIPAKNATNIPNKPWPSWSPSRDKGIVMAGQDSNEGNASEAPALENTTSSSSSESTGDDNNNNDVQTNHVHFHCCYHTPKDQARQKREERTDKKQPRPEDQDTPKTASSSSGSSSRAHSSSSRQASEPPSVLELFACYLCLPWLWYSPTGERPDTYQWGLRAENVRPRRRRRAGLIRPAEESAKTKKQNGVNGPGQKNPKDTVEQGPSNQPEPTPESEPEPEPETSKQTTTKKDKGKKVVTKNNGNNEASVAGPSKLAATSAAPSSTSNGGDIFTSPQSEISNATEGGDNPVSVPHNGDPSAASSSPPSTIHSGADSPLKPDSNRNHPADLIPLVGGWRASYAVLQRAARTRASDLGERRPKRHQKWLALKKALWLVRAWAIATRIMTETMTMTTIRSQTRAASPVLLQPRSGVFRYDTEEIWEHERVTEWGCMQR
ncbi:hypothetical protein PG997_002839 [Apiospora hydei]|uniref:Ankyrin repeat protein n=1 Tax=Apiospora hydei TaxID=1337664 RepID=A0ABR1WXI3_9PEZI